MQSETGLDTLEPSYWTDAITEAIRTMCLSDGCVQMVVDDLPWVLDVSRLHQKIEQTSELVSSSQITVDQLIRLMRSVYILPEKDQPTDCLRLYADMASPLGIKPLH